jgi:hypothetical protein
MWYGKGPCPAAKIISNLAKAETDGPVKSIDLK